MVSMIFKPAARYPADPRAVFVLALSVFSGMTALALSAAPHSLEALLPGWAVYLWGITLSAGSATALIGMALQSVNGIVVEQVGNVMVSVSTIYYSGLVLWIVGPGAIQTVGIILAWGLSCAIRWAQLQVLIRNAACRQQKQEVVAQLYAEIQRRADEEILRRKHRPGRR